MFDKQHAQKQVSIFEKGGFLGGCQLLNRHMSVQVFFKHCNQPASLVMEPSDDEVAELQEPRNRSEPYPTVKSVPSTKWSHHDSNVACAAEAFKGPTLKLPWETGFVGAVLSKKPLLSLPLVGDNPMQVGKSDFLLGIASTISSVPAAPLLPKIPGHVRKIKLMSWLQEDDDLKARALAMVRTIIESDLAATQLGSLIHELAHDLSNEH